MKCSKVRERLFEYIDGTLSKSELGDIEEHLRSCPDCQLELAQVKGFDARLKLEVPAYLESIEPSPAFLNRLKRLDLEPTPIKNQSILDTLLALFQQHRVAWGTGLAVCLIIALAFAIPTITFDDEDKDTTIAEQMTAEPEAAREEMMEEPGITGPTFDEMGKSAGDGGAVNTTPLPTESLPNYLSSQDGTEMAVTGIDAEATPPPVPEPAPTPAIPEATDDYDTGDTAAPVILGTTQTEEEAISLALEDPDVEAILEDNDILSIEVRYDFSEEEYTCSLYTVAIELGETDPPESILYVCVDTETGTAELYQPDE
ncbi:MAG: zf-HC2 domain-containing protein [Chloroflexi bacterium]|jgi:hypothetical protein|nr:zf-HC2 domain-containing protein [Chloroflexota bacterium]